MSIRNLIIGLLFFSLVVAFKLKKQKQQHQVKYLNLYDDTYFYPPRFPVPRPQLRPHEMSI
jgi:hypothetical protein